MTETDVALTDYGLTLECGVFVIFLARLPIRPGVRKSELIGFFLSIAVAAATGGSVHGFFRNESTLGYKVLWRATLFLIGITALCGLRIGTAMLMPNAAAAYVNSCSSILFVVYALIALFLWQDFRIAIIGYLPSLLVLGAGFLVQYHLRQGFGNLVGFFGICTMVIAGLLQQLRVPISGRYLDHNALYHVLQAVALYMLYIAVRPATG